MAVRQALQESEEVLLFLFRLVGEVTGTFDGAPVVGIEIGVEIWTDMVDHETQIGDLVALGREHPLVESLYFEQGVNRGFSGDRTQCTTRQILPPRSVKIIGAGQNPQPILLRHRFGIFIKKAAVRLEVDYSALFQELAVTLKEKRACETAVLALHLRVGEGQPYFRNLIGSEEGLDELDSGAQEGHIRKMVLRGELRSFPKPAPLMSTPM